MNKRIALLAASIYLLGLGCTRESVRIALSESDNTWAHLDACFDNAEAQAEWAWRMMLFDKIGEQRGSALTTAEMQEYKPLIDDLKKLKRWRIDWERTRALYNSAVYSRLVADQSMLDLQVKGLKAKTGRWAASQPE